MNDTPSHRSATGSRLRTIVVLGMLFVAVVASVAVLGRSTAASLSAHITESFFRSKHLVAEDVRHKLENHMLRVANLSAQLAALTDHEALPSTRQPRSVALALAELERLNGATAVFAVRHGEPSPLNDEARIIDVPASPWPALPECELGTCWRRGQGPTGAVMEAFALHRTETHGIGGALLVFPLSQAVLRVFEGLGLPGGENLWVLAQDGTVLGALREPAQVGENLFEAPGTCDACHDGDGGLHGWVPRRGDHYMVLPEEHALTVYSPMDFAGERWSVCLATSHQQLSTQVSGEIWRFVALVLVISAAVLVLIVGMFYFARRRRQAEQRTALVELRAEHLGGLADQRGRELDQEKDRLQHIVSSIGAGLSLLDRDYNVVWMNSVATGWHGSTRSPLGRPCWEVFHDSDEQCAGCTVGLSFDSGEVSQAEHVHVKANGEDQVVRITATPVRDHQGEITQVLQLIEDVSAQRQLEQRIRHTEDLALLGRLAAGVAHEIGNPMTSISSFIQILRERSKDEFTTRSLETVFSHIQRVSRIVHQMSNLARPPRPRPKPTRLLDPVRRVVEVLAADQRFEDRSIELSAPGDDEPTLDTDSSLVEQVVMNLAINGLQAIGSGGHLDIACTTAAEANGSDSRFYRIDIEDDGPGVAEEDRGRIFEPFFSTKDHGTGAGLGLYISRQILLSIGGRIQVEPRTPRGMRFSILLPEVFPVTQSAALSTEGMKP